MPPTPTGCAPFPFPTTSRPCALESLSLTTSGDKTMKALKTLVAVAAALLAGAAQADITIGISLPLTGPASGLGIPMANYIKLWPQSIAGEKLNVIVLDDATDPTKGV